MTAKKATKKAPATKAAKPAKGAKPARKRSRRPRRCRNCQGAQARQGGEAHFRETEGDGLSIWYKRLEAGTYAIPQHDGDAQRARGPRGASCATCGRQGGPRATS